VCRCVAALDGLHGVASCRSGRVAGTLDRWSRAALAIAAMRRREDGEHGPRTAVAERAQLGVEVRRGHRIEQQRARQTLRCERVQPRAEPGHERRAGRMTADDHGP